MTRRLSDVELLGRVSDDEKARCFATADVYVSPATGRESFGIVLLEAMAAGTPIVCSDIHGYKGVVQAGRAGAARAAARLGGRSPRRSAGSSTTRTCARRMGRVGLERVAAVRLGPGRGPGRRLLRVRDPAARGAGALPPGFHAEVPPDPRAGVIA